MANHAQTEIYVRFYSKAYDMYGIHEGPCHSIEEAAGQFAEDSDCISATRMTFDEAGALVSAENVTDAVIGKLKELIEDDTYTSAPHPMVEDFFAEWEREVEHADAERRDHERVESAMLHI